MNACKQTTILKQRTECGPLEQMMTVSQREDNSWELLTSRIGVFLCVTRRTREAVFAASVCSLSPEGDDVQPEVVALFSYMDPAKSVWT